MPILPIVLVVEIISALLISSVTPNTVSTIKHSLHQVFPLAIAQEDPTPVSTDQPSDSSSDSQPAQQSSSPSDTTQTSTTDNNSTLLNDINSQAQQGPTDVPQTNQSSDQTNQANDKSQSFSVIVDEPAVSQASITVLNSADIVGGPAEIVDEKTVAMTQKQDEQIAKANTPAEAAGLSIDFAKDSIKEVENHIRVDNFSTISFVTQRLSNHIDTALEQSQKVGSTKLSNQLKSFCKQADLLIRSQQLVVPEQGEQDFEIIRGKCLDITQ